MTETKKWYREPWPWILMTGPAAVVVAGFVTAWLAASTDDGLVEDDYYKKGLAINQTLERDQLASKLQVRARLTAGEDGLLRLMLEAGESAPLPPTLRLKVLHPTRSGMDQVVVLTRVASGQYEGRIETLGAARWRLVLEDMENRWRLTGAWQSPGERAVTLQSGE